MFKKLGLAAILTVIMACFSEYRTLMPSEAIEFQGHMSIISYCIAYGLIEDADLLFLVALDSQKDAFKTNEEGLVQVKTPIYNKLLKISKKCKNKLDSII